MGGGSDRYHSKSKASSFAYKGGKGASKTESSHTPSPASEQPYIAPPSAISAADKEAVMNSFVHTADKTGIDVAFSFDTTGSMYPCLAEVRKKLTEISTRLLKDIPNIRIALIAHGDYCDSQGTYAVKSIDFTTDVEKLTKFAQGVQATGGGDAPECYELSLKHARSLAWDQNHSKALVIIGDEVPHARSYTTEKIFWRDEIEALKNIGVAVYGVQALNNGHATAFYSEISSETGGFHLHLQDFSLITEMFVAVCFRATSQEKFEEYKQGVEEDGRANVQVQKMWNEMAKPTEKKKFDLKADWWDPKYDNGKPVYKYIAEKDKWVGV